MAGAGRLAVLGDPLVTFPLARRIVAEGRDAVLCEQDRSTLVFFFGLAIGAMTAGDEHAGERPASLGQEEQRRNVMRWPALEQDLFQAIAVARRSRRDQRVQRRPLGESPESFDEEPLHA